MTEVDDRAEVAPTDEPGLVDALESLRESEWRFRQLATNIRQVFWMAVPGEQILYVSPAYEEIWGRPCQTLYDDPKSWVEAIHADDRDQAFASMERQASGEQTEVEYRIVRPDGGVRWIWDRGFPVREGLDHRQVFTGLAEDVTEFKEREHALRATAAELRASERRFRSLIRAAGSPILLLSTDGRVLEWNREAQALFGWPSEQLEGFDYVGRCVPEADRAPWRDAVKAVLDGHLVNDYEHRAFGRDGQTRDVLCSLRPLEDADGRARGLIVVGHDITERRRREAERRKLEAELQKARELESLAVLAGGIAHDFNNVLTGIRLSAETALLSAPSDPELQDDLDRIIGSTHQAAQLTGRLLAYSGRGAFTTEPIDLSALAAKALQHQDLSVPDRVHLELDLADSLPTVMADPHQIRQVLVSLVDNAFEAIEDARGAVDVRTGCGQVREPEHHDALVRGELPEARAVYLEVSDTGVGMTPETMERIFDPFFTTKFLGRGLGLAAVMGIVTGQNGALTVRSRPGVGTTVRVLFPESTHPTEAYVEVNGSLPTATKTILVVDDEPLIRRYAQRIFGRAGYEVLTASDGREAIGLCLERRGRIALALLDLTMPHMNGDEVARELRSVCPHLKVILSSGYGEGDVGPRIAALGVSAFLKKPYEASKLLRVVSEVLDTG